MRTWKKEEAFQEWKKGVGEMTFPVTKERLGKAETHFKKAIVIESGCTFAEAAEKDKGFSRAWSRLGYCYMTRYIEGFIKSKSPKADEYTARAVRMDPLNYDVHWDRAIFYQLTEQFVLAKKSFQRARDLNDCNVDLIVEQSELYLNIGCHDHALKLLRKAGEFVHHDWFHWNFAWTYYFKARCDPVYYEEALDHIGAMHWQPGEPRYMYDIQLLKAAIHARMRDNGIKEECRSTEEEDSLTEEERELAEEKRKLAEEKFKSQQESLRLNAKEQFQKSCVEYRPWTKDREWGTEDEDRWHKFARDEDRDHWLEGVDLGLA